MMKEIGKRIKEELEKNNMPQKELAIKTGCTEAAISLYIKGERTPRAKVLSKIAIALNTTSDYLTAGIPTNVKEELGYAKKLIARNVTQMSADEKVEIMKILMGGSDNNETIK